MNLLMLYPIQSCNLNCAQCPTSEYTYPIDSSLNSLNNEVIFNYIDKFLHPNYWLIEISGGEPSIYPGINELVNGLNDRGYVGTIRTNGIIPIEKTNNFQIVSAWHYPIPLETPPVSCDSVFITRNPKDDWKAKIEYCERNNIPYTCVKYQHYDGSPQEKIDYDESNYPRVIKYLDGWMVVYSSGRMGSCYSNLMGLQVTMQNMSAPVIQEISGRCRCCEPLLGFELSLTDKTRSKIEEKIKKTTNSFSK